MKMSKHLSLRILQARKGLETKVTTKCDSYSRGICVASMEQRKLGGVREVCREELTLHSTN